MMRSLVLGLLLVGSTLAGDYVNTVTGELALDRSSDYTSVGAVAAGWIVLDRSSAPPEALAEAQATGRVRLDVWDVDPNTGMVTADDQEALDDSRAVALAGRRRGFWLEIVRLRQLRSELRTDPPTWASEELLDAAEAEIDATVTTLTAAGAAP